VEKQKKDQPNENTRPITHQSESGASPPVITVDYKLYAHYLENSGLTAEEKREFLQTIWNIVCEFVSLGFGVHPVQQAQFSCGKQEEITELPDSGSSNNVKYAGDPLIKSFADAVGEKTEVPEETES